MQVSGEVERARLSKCCSAVCERQVVAFTQVGWDDSGCGVQRGVKQLRGEVQLLIRNLGSSD